MNYTEHIAIYPQGQWTIVSIRDYELFDQIDDFLVSKSLEYLYCSEDVAPDGKPIHRMYFASQVTPELLLQTLQEIPAEEIERIYRLNN